MGAFFCFLLALWLAACHSAPPVATTPESPGVDTASDDSESAASDEELEVDSVTLLNQPLERADFSILRYALWRYAPAEMHIAADDAGSLERNVEAGRVVLRDGRLELTQLGLATYRAYGELLTAVRNAPGLTKLPIPEGIDEEALKARMRDGYMIITSQDGRIWLNKLGRKILQNLEGPLDRNGLRPKTGGSAEAVLGDPRWRFPQRLSDLRLSPDGRWLVGEGRFDRHIHVLDARSGRHMASFDVGETVGRDRRFGFSQSGDHLAVLGYKGKLFVHDLSTGRRLRSLSLPMNEELGESLVTHDDRIAVNVRGVITVLSFDADVAPVSIPLGKAVDHVAFSSDPDVVWAGKASEPLQKCFISKRSCERGGPPLPSRTVALLTSPDGAHIFVVSATEAQVRSTVDGSIGLQRGKIAFGAGWLPDGRWWSGTPDGAVQAGLPEGTPAQLLPPGSVSDGTVVVHPKVGFINLRTDDVVPRRFDFDGRRLDSPAGHQSGVRELVALEDGKVLSRAWADAILWTGDEATLTVRPDDGRLEAVDARQGVLVVGGESEISRGFGIRPRFGPWIKTFDIATRAEKSTWDPGDLVRDIMFDPSGRVVAVVGLEPQPMKVIRWNSAGRGQEVLFTRSDRTNIWLSDQARSVLVAPEAGLGPPSPIRHVSTVALQSKRERRFEDVTLADAWLSNDGRRAAAMGSMRSRLLLLDMVANSVMSEMVFRQTRLEWVAFSNDGQQLATATDDGVLVLLDPETGLVTTTLETNLGRTKAGVWLSDGQLAVGCADGLIRIYRPEKQR